MAKEQVDPGEVEALINELETKMSRLRAIYEQYFMGIERMPPHTLRKDVVRLIHRLEGIYIRNTAVKFKVRSLIQRFNSYKAYWSRVERQIEEGTYVRDIRRAERNRERRRERSQNRRGGDDSAAPSDDGIVELNFEDVVDLREFEVELEALDAGGAFDRPKEPHVPAAAAAAAPMDAAARKRAKLAEIAGQLGLSDAKPAEPRPEPQPRTAPASATPAARGPAVSVGSRREKLAEIKARMQRRTDNAGGGDDDARRVYNQLLEAKRRCNEPTDKISYDSVAKSITKQRQQLKQTRGGDVEFKVVIKDGRAFIKPETK